MAIIDRPWKDTETFRCLPRFLAVGFMGTFVDVGLFTGLHVLLGVPTLVANTFSYSAGMLNNFVLHRRWTFADRSGKAMSAQFMQFVLVNIIALTLNTLLVLVLAHPFNALLTYPGSGDLLAKLFATGVSMSWNFIANNFWTFKSPIKETLSN